MIKIGDFSRLTRISIRMLRYYDEHDVLKPAYIDEDSGYRYYDQGQLKEASNLLFLKNAGFSVSAMKEMLALEDKQELRQYLRIRKQELNDVRDQIMETINRLTIAEQLLMKEDELMQYQVNVREVPSVKVVSKRGIAPSYERVDLMWKGLYNEVHERNLSGLLKENSVPRCYYYDEGYKEQDVDVEVCHEVTEEMENSENLHFKILPAQTCACVKFQGSYDQISEVCLTIGIWIQENGYELDGTYFSIYHKGPGVVENAGDYVTEICFPVRKK